MKIKTVWDFVEQYYPNYGSCNEIVLNNDLCKLINEEQENGDCADQLLTSDYNGDINNSHILIDKHISDAKIFKRAIQKYINELKIKD